MKAVFCILPIVFLFSNTLFAEVKEVLEKTRVMVGETVVYSATSSEPIEWVYEEGFENTELPRYATKTILRTKTELKLEIQCLEPGKQKIPVSYRSGKDLSPSPSSIEVLATTKEGDSPEGNESPLIFSGPIYRKVVFYTFLILILFFVYSLYEFYKFKSSRKVLEALISKNVELGRLESIEFYLKEQFQKEDVNVREISHLISLYLRERASKIYGDSLLGKTDREMETFYYNHFQFGEERLKEILSLLEKNKFSILNIFEPPQPYQELFQYIQRKIG